MPTEKRFSLSEFFGLRPRADIHWARLAIALWCVLFLVVAIYSIVTPGTEARPRQHTVSTVYWKAAKQWWNSEDMYGSKEATLEGLHGFLYFPQAAVLFTPLAYLPETAAEVAWRFLGLATASWALWRMCKIFGRDRPLLWFGLGTLLGMPVMALSSQNGQCNLILLAIMAHATADIILGRWWRGAVLLALGLALKPHMLVFVLLLTVLQPQMRLRLVVCALGAAAIALINPNWVYVWQEHIEFVKKMQVAAHPAPGTEQDLVTLIWAIGYTLPDRAWLVIRLAGAGAISLLALLATLRFERAVSLLYVFTLSILYIMIFNPRTETATHTMIGISLALFAVQELTTRRTWVSWAFIPACILMGLAQKIVPGNRWVWAIIEICFAVYIGVHVLRNRPLFSGVRVPDGEGRQAQPLAAGSIVDPVAQAPAR